jgi:AraC-like DNA-binding protein
VGFGDLSYFNRAFRRRFDRTPRDVRAETGRELRLDRTPLANNVIDGLVD